MAVNINIGDRKDADNGYISNSVYFLGSALRKNIFNYQQIKKQPE